MIFTTRTRRWWSMQAEEATPHVVAMFLTSNLHLLNRIESWAWRRAQLRPLRKSTPVRRINKSSESQKHTTWQWRGGRGVRKGCYMDENRLSLGLSSNWSIPLSSYLWHYSHCLYKTPALCRACLCLIDWPPHLHLFDWPVYLPLFIWGVVRSLIGGGSIVTVDCSWTFSDWRLCDSPLASLHSSCAATVPDIVIVASEHVSHIREADNSQNLHSVKARHKFSSARRSACGTVRPN